MKKQKLFVAGLLNDNFYEAYYIIDLAQNIVDSVKSLYGITIKPEVNYI